MNTIQKSLACLLILAILCALPACASGLQPYEHNKNHSGTDSKGNQFPSSGKTENGNSTNTTAPETTRANTAPQVPASAYQSKVESQTEEWKNYYAKYYDTEIEVVSAVYRFPDESTHRETVQIGYLLENGYGYKTWSIGYVYQYHKSDDIWELIYSPSQYDLVEFDICWNSFPRHWTKSKTDFDYTIDILGIDEDAQTITISYLINDSKYGVKHRREGTQTIRYSLSGSHYEAELEDGATYTIQLDLFGLICYN